MKAWQKQYSKEELDEALKIVEDVKIKRNDDVEIIAMVGDFKVETIMEFNNPSYLSCTCPSIRPCRHEAALVYYIINHPELYSKKQDFNELFNLVCEDDLKNFLLKEFNSNKDLKDRFINYFAPNLINEDFYRDKLSDVFRRGEGRDFDDHGFHDLDLMEDELYEFLFTDIPNILSAGEHDLACELLIRIAKLLNDEVISTYDSWYNLTDRFMEQVHALSFSIYLDGEKLDELYSNMDHIMNCI